MKDNETPLKILRQIVELHDYYNGPIMSGAGFEGRLDAIRLHAEEIIAARKAELERLTKPVSAVKSEPTMQVSNELSIPDAYIPEPGAMDGFDTCICQVVRITGKKESGFILHTKDGAFSTEPGELGDSIIRFMQGKARKLLKIVHVANKIQEITLA